MRETRPACHSDVVPLQDLLGGMDPTSAQWGAKLKAQRELRPYTGPCTEEADLEEAYSTLRPDLDYHTLSENAAAARLPMHSEGDVGEPSCLNSHGWVRDHAEHWSRTLEPGRWQGGMNDEKDWQSGGTLLAAQGAEPPAVGKPWSPAPKHCRERLLIKQDQREDILEPVDAWDRKSGARSPRAAPMLLDVSGDHRWAEQHEAAPLALNRFPMTII